VRSPAITVRQRVADDVPTLGQVLVRVHAKDGYPVEGVADPNAWIEPPNELRGWTSEVDGEPVGHISLTAATEDDDAARLWRDSTGGNIADLAIPVRLFVDPPHRGQGIANRLMLAAYEFALSQGRSVAFDVMLKDRDAIRLYESLGCKFLGQITHHHSDGLEEPAAVYEAPASLSVAVTG
jgi:GNAT superfamily N-acetyltransferase